MRLAVIFAYDGRKFQGYARQPQMKTIEGEIIETLIKNRFIENAKESYFRSASRTDKGVSALCNVFAFNTDASKKRVLQILSDEFTNIVVYGIKEVKNDFNPRHAKLRQYRYYLPKGSLDLEKTMSTAAIFTGKHDFSNFARIEQFRDPVRTIDNIVFAEKNCFLNIDFYAQTFLWNQIRRIVSAIEKVASGKLEKKQIITALRAPDKMVDLGLAPAEPLLLKNIIYDFEFEYGVNIMQKITELENRIVKNLNVPSTKSPKR